jgi:HK97 family phage major capsid protein
MELKDLQAQLQTAFTELKAMGQRSEDEIKKFGQASQETNEQIAKINKEMDNFKSQIDELAKKANRINFEGGKPQKSEEEQKKHDAFFKFIRKGITELTREEKALVQDATGDILVTADLDNTIYRALPQLNVIRGLASVRGTKSDRVRRIGMNEVTTGWGKIEIQTNPKLASFESSLTPTETYAYVEDAYGLTKIGEDELEDSDYDLTQYLTDSFSDAYANMEELAFLKGTGHAAMQPEGILNGTTVTRFNTATANTLVADDMIKLAYQVPSVARKNGVYMVNPLIELAMRLMKDTTGQYLWQPSLQAGAPSMFNGKPVYNVEPMDTATTTGKEVAIFGDIKSAYQIIDRKEGAIKRIDELYLNDGLIGFRYKRRVGGYVKRANALRVLKIT